MKIANRDARKFVQQQHPFQGNNLFSVAYDDLYVVYSYGTHFPIYIHSTLTRRWYANKDRYSPSTSRHQSLTRPFTNDTDAVWLTTSEMRTLARDGVVALTQQRLCGSLG